MTKFYRFGCLLASLLLSTSVYAGNIQVEEVWTRATAPGQDSANVYLLITSKQAATLVGVSSTASRTAEMHTMSHKNGMMKMCEVKSIDLPANKHVDMNSLHSYHLMLIGLKAPLKAGATVPLTLNVELADKHSVKVDIQAKVKPLMNATNN